MKKLFILFILAIGLLTQSIAQEEELDSLLKVLPKATSDTERIKTLGQISELCDFSDIQKYSNQVLDLVEKNKVATNLKSKRVFLSEKARAYNNLGVYYYTGSKLIDALDCYQKSALILENDNINYELLNSVYNNMAAIEMNIGENNKALQALQKCLKADIISGNKSYIANDYNNLASLFANLNNTDSALYYGLKAITLKEAALNPTPNNEGVSFITSL